MARLSRYQQALAELDDLHRAGRIDDDRYQKHRRRLLAEERRSRHPLVRKGRRAMIIAAVVATIVLIGLLVWAVVSTVQMWSAG